MITKGFKGQEIVEGHDYPRTERTRHIEEVSAKYISFITLSC